MRVSRTLPKSPKSPPTRREPDGRESGALPPTLKARSRPGDSTLQRHAPFFDDNGARGVDVAERTRGLRAPGLPFGVAEAAALAIFAPLSIQTRGSLLALKIEIEEARRHPALSTTVQRRDPGAIRGRDSARGQPQLGAR